MHEIIASKLFSVAITLLIFYVVQRLYNRYQHPLLNPVLITIGALILFLKAFSVEYEAYFAGGRIISFFLGPSVVALGIPLYQNLKVIQKQKKAILFSLILGSITGIVTASGIARLLMASPEVVRSLAPKSVTTPIAMGIAEEIGGIPPLTAAIVIVTGILGAVLGPAFLKLLKIKSPTAFGLAMGAASHGLGTARSIEEGEVQGAMSGLALCLNGIFTAILTPILITILV